MLLILLIRGIPLPGAGDEVYYYMYPDLDGLANIEVCALMPPPQFWSVCFFWMLILLAVDSHIMKT